MNCIKKGTVFTTFISYCTEVRSQSAVHLYKYLLRQCQKLPDDGPKKFYINSVKQSFKQHVKETDPERVQQIIKRAYKDADWILKKYSKV